MRAYEILSCRPFLVFSQYSNGILKCNVVNPVRADRPAFLRPLLLYSAISLMHQSGLFGAAVIRPTWFAKLVTHRNGVSRMRDRAAKSDVTVAIGRCGRIAFRSSARSAARGSGGGGRSGGSKNVAGSIRSRVHHAPVTVLIVFMRSTYIHTRKWR